MPENVRFAVADVCRLPYGDGSFDAVAIMNALHILPDPACALQNIRRVLTPNGILFAPTFTHGENTRIGERLRGAAMAAAGLRVMHKWTHAGFLCFLEKNGFGVTKAAAIPGPFQLTYAQARKRASFESEATP